MKKILSFILIALMLFSGGISSVFAVEEETPTTPETPPSTSTEEPTETPDPTPETPSATPENTPDNSYDNDNSYNNNNYDDSYYYDNSQSNTTQNNNSSTSEPQATAAPTPTPSASVAQPYTVTAETKDNTITVTVKGTAATQSTTGDTDTIEVLDAVLTAAIAEATTQVTAFEKEKPNQPATVLITLPEMTTKNTKTKLVLHGPSFKGLKAKGIKALIKINGRTYSLTTDILPADKLTALTDADTFVLNTSEGSALSDKSYPVANDDAKPVFVPFTLDTAIVTADGKATAVDTFNTPLAVSLALSDNSSAVGNPDQLVICSYNASKNSVTAMTGTYNNTTKAFNFSISAPGNFVLMERNASAALNPLFIIVPLVVIALIGGFIWIKKSKNKRGPSLD